MHNYWFQFLLNDFLLHHGYLDLDFENEANFDEAIEVSAYKEEGIDFFKDKLLETIP